MTLRVASGNSWKIMETALWAVKKKKIQLGLRHLLARGNITRNSAGGRQIRNKFLPTKWTPRGRRELPPKIDVALHNGPKTTMWLTPVSISSLIPPTPFLNPIIWSLPMKLSRSLILAVSIASLSSLSVLAFQITQQPRSSASIFSKNRLHSKNSDDDGRRSFLSRSAGTAMSVLLGGTVSGQPAVASYTAYARREEDWKERADKGGESLTKYIRINHTYLHHFPPRCRF